jgi:hypothetical protein
MLPPLPCSACTCTCTCTCAQLPQAQAAAAKLLPQDADAARIADRAAQQVAAAAARSIQPSKEELAAAAAGVKRSYARAEGLPEGLWQQLKDKYTCVS